VKRLTTAGRKPKPGGDNQDPGDSHRLSLHLHIHGVANVRARVADIVLVDRRVDGRLDP
jgi:hypothetical protein